MKRFLFSAAVGMSTLWGATAQAFTLDPTDMRGIRESTGCAPLCLLNSSAVKSGTEDRTVAHFDISTLSSFTSATLELSLQDQDGFSPGSSNLDIYAFAGDGTVSVDEFGLGTLISEVSGITGSPTTVSLDITGLLTTALSNGDTYLSFNLRNKDGDRGRFFLSHVIGGTYGTSSSAGPTTIELTGVPDIPLPAGGLLLLTGFGAVVIARQRRS